MGRVLALLANQAFWFGLLILSVLGHKILELGALSQQWNHMVPDPGQTHADKMELNVLVFFFFSFGGHI